MKLIEKNTDRVVEIKMHIVDDNKIGISMDISNDFFDSAADLEVSDINYCIEQVKNWVDGTGDFIEFCRFNRMAEINGELYTNYEL